MESNSISIVEILNVENINPNQKSQQASRSMERIAQLNQNSHISNANLNSATPQTAHKQFKII